MPSLQKSASLFDQSVYSRARRVFEPNLAQLHDDAKTALAVEVIRRLEQSRRVARDGTQDRPSKQELSALCNALLQADESSATDLLFAAQRQGVSIGALYQGYLAGAARHMGEMWENDEMSSADVVIGAGIIYAIMRGMQRAFGSHDPVLPDAFRAAFATVPGETHTLGVTMAADQLRSHGWQIDLFAGMTHDTLVEKISAFSYPIIGLSASCTSMIFPMARLIVALRVSNPGAWIAVNGKITELEPEIQQLVDADGIANDLATAEAHMMARMVPQEQGARG